MAETEQTWNPNTKSVDTRETKDVSDVAKATSKSDPRTAGSVLGAGKADPDEPKTEDFGSDLVGRSKYSKALKSYRASKMSGGQKAVTDMLKAQ